MTAISTLPAGVALTGTDILYAVQTIGVGGVFITGAQIAEFVRDEVANFIVQGPNIGVVHNDAADTLTVSYVGATPPADTDDLPEGGTNLYFTNARAITAVGPVRVRLTANATYFVNPSTGSDSNSGLSSGSAFATLQRALDVVAAMDGAGLFSATINLANGTYTEAVILRSLVGYTQVNITGNLTTPSNVLIDGSASGATLGTLDSAFAGQGRYLIQGVRLRAAKVNGFGIRNANSTQFFEIGNIEFDQCSRADLFIVGAGATIRMVGDVNHVSSAAQTNILELSVGGRFDGIGGTFTVSGSPAITQMYNLINGSAVFLNGRPLVISGSPSFSVAGVLCTTNSVWGRGGAAVTVTGAPTGPRFSVSTGGQIATNGAGLTFLPGSVAGTQDLASFGKYT